MKKDLGPEAMQLMAELLKTLMPPGWGFTLLTFETNGTAGKILYISSAERDSMKLTMEIMLAKWNKGEDFLTINPN